MLYISSCDNNLRDRKNLLILHPIAYIYWGLRNDLPAYLAPAPSSSSIRRIWLYLARRSDLHGAPVFIWPVDKPTTKSAINVSSVSPDLKCKKILSYGQSTQLSIKNMFLLKNPSQMWFLNLWSKIFEVQKGKGGYWDIC